MAKSENLSDAKIRTFKTPEKETILRDSSGLLLRIFPNGRKRFGWRFIDKHRNRRSRIEYGDYPDLSLDYARQLHQLSVAARKNGKDILDNEVRSNIYKKVMGEDAIIEHQPGMTFSQLVNDYYNKHIKPNNINPNAYNRIKNHLLPVFKNDKAESIPIAKIQGFVKGMRESGNITETTIADTIRFAVIMYNHAVRQFWINNNPFSAVTIERQKSVRKEYYTMGEIKTLLTNPDDIKIGKDFYLIQKALILSGVRRSELMHAEIKEFDFDSEIWTIPAERLKNQKGRTQSQKEPLKLPMSKQFIKTIQEAVDGFGNDTHVFGSKQNAFIDNRWQRQKTGPSSDRNYHNAITEYRRYYQLGHKINHDFRRSIETTLGNLGVSSDITSIMTGHSKSGIKAVYNQASLMLLMRVAFQLYADLIDFFCEADNKYLQAFDHQKLCRQLSEIYQKYHFNVYQLSMLNDIDPG